MLAGPIPDAADLTRPGGARPPVGEGGLEPPPPCGDMALNHARLPVPPLALVYALNLRKAALSGCSESFAAAEVAPDAANHVSGYRKQLSRNLFRIKFWISGPRGLFGSAQPWTPTIHVLFRRHEARPTRTPELRRHMAV